MKRYRTVPVNGALLPCERALLPGFELRLWTTSRVDIAPPPLQFRVGVPLLPTPVVATPRPLPRPETITNTRTGMRRVEIQLKFSRS